MKTRERPKHRHGPVYLFAMVAVCLSLAPVRFAAAADGNLEAGDGAAVVGGVLNTASGDYSFVGAGRNNTANNDIAVVAGGE